MNKKIVFINQLADVDEIGIERAYGTINDPKAATLFGVRMYKEFGYWAWRACAIANVAMVLATEGKLQETLYDLVCEALRKGGYAFRNRRGQVDVGWKHETLCDLLRDRGFHAQARKLDVDKIQTLINEGKYVIASVKSERGGHMVLLKKVSEDEVIYNDPYVFGGSGGEDVRETWDSFGGKFLRRGVIAWLV